MEDFSLKNQREHIRLKRQSEQMNAVIKFENELRASGAVPSSWIWRDDYLDALVRCSWTAHPHYAEWPIGYFNKNRRKNVPKGGQPLLWLKHMGWADFEDKVPTPLGYRILWRFARERACFPDGFAGESRGSEPTSDVRPHGQAPNPR